MILKLSRIMVGLMSVAALVCSACSSSDDEPEPPIAGHSGNSGVPFGGASGSHTGGHGGATQELDDSDGGIAGRSNTTQEPDDLDGGIAGSGSAGQPSPQPSEDPCAGSLALGWICSSSNQFGFSSNIAEANTLYYCQDGATLQTKTCSNGCTVAPEGQADTCNESSSSSTPTLSNEIELIAFLTLTDRPWPYVFFRGGNACSDPDIVLENTTEQAHKNAHPNAWFEWRRNGTQLEIQRSGHWVPMRDDSGYGPLQAGTRISGTFQWLYESTFVDRYQFRSDGTYSFCRAIPTGVSTVRDRLDGTYSIDGFKLTLLNPSDGTQVVAMFYNPNYSEQIWVDSGYYYRVDSGRYRTNDGSQPCGF